MVYPRDERTLQRKDASEVQGLLQGIAIHAELEPRVMQGVGELARQMEKQASADQLRVFGSQNILFHPEFSDVEKARGLKCS